MDFKVSGFIVICKDPETYYGYFGAEDSSVVSDIEDATIFYDEDLAKSFIEDCDTPDDFTYKPVEVTYRVKNLKLS